jgi:hypothetical protein
MPPIFTVAIWIPLGEDAGEDRLEVLHPEQPAGAVLWKKKFFFQFNYILSLFIINLLNFKFILH